MSGGVNWLLVETIRRCVCAVESVLDECLGPAGQSADVQVQCPPNYNLLVISADVYKSSSDCPSTTIDACWHSNITQLVTTACNGSTSTAISSSCQLTVAAPTSSLHCDLNVYPADYFVVVNYRCQPGSTALLYTTARRDETCAGRVLVNGSRRGGLSQLQPH